MITQKKLAHNLKMKTSYLSKVLSGQRRLSRSRAYAVAKDTGIKVETILYGDFAAALERKYGPINFKRGRMGK